MQNFEKGGGGGRCPGSLIHIISNYVLIVSISKIFVVRKIRILKILQFSFSPVFRFY